MTRRSLRRNQRTGERSYHGIVTAAAKKPSQPIVSEGEAAWLQSATKISASCEKWLASISIASGSIVPAISGGVQRRRKSGAGVNHRREKRRQAT